MGFLKSWDSVYAFIRTNDIQRWNISRTKGNQSNDNVFLYNSEKTFDDNLNTSMSLLNMFAGDMLYFVGWTGDKSKTNGFSAIIQYENQQQPATPQVAGVGSGSAIDIQQLTQDIRREIKNEFDQERLTRERKEFEDARRDFQQKQDGVVGLLVQYLAPVAQQLAGRLSPRVAGIDAEEPVSAQPIHAEPVSTEQSDVEEEEPFTDEEGEELMELMQRFKAVEPNYIELIRRVVELAEAGDSTYTMAKQFLIK
ncbi:MAG: hypothetical protein NC346_09020 [Prevotella sp.]|nr:hypothetical protein [Prevotella sp.]MCM1443663.1 hypothetical protein [Muribaculum sp.]MCM1577154.1 hypothetical protein [Bacteroides sp.]